MFPTLRALLEVRRCFPRSRGDVPGIINADDAAREFSPLTRGCSRGRYRVPRDGNVFPAHAGMFPAPANVTTIPASFPRSRGDVPRTHVLKHRKETFSPLTRGCSHLHQAPIVAHWVFPAHAGMFPPLAGPVYAAPGFPRSRGDVPGTINIQILQNKFSPLTRGCSLLWARGDGSPLVFPAHAGMFRCSPLL